jgi:hypothetical protein
VLVCIRGYMSQGGTLHDSTNVNNYEDAELVHRLVKVPIGEWLGRDNMRLSLGEQVERKIRCRRCLFSLDVSSLESPE